jgi:hypothetical protein
MKVEDNGVTFDFSGVAVREIKVEDEFGMIANINVNITSNINFVTTRYDGEFNFGKTKTGRDKRKCDFNAFFKCLEDNAIPVTINYIPAKGLFMVNRLKKVLYLDEDGNYEPKSIESTSEVIPWEEGDGRD